MNFQDRVDWLNERDPLHFWSVAELIVCGHCERNFKAEDYGKYADRFEDLPCCPFCEATPLDFWPWEKWQDAHPGECVSSCVRAGPNSFAE
jgi:hypothetical protein